MLWIVKIVYNVYSGWFYVVNLIWAFNYLHIHHIYRKNSQLIFQESVRAAHLHVFRLTYQEKIMQILFGAWDAAEFLNGLELICCRKL